MNPALIGVLAAAGVHLATEEEDAAPSKPTVPKPRPGTTRYAADLRPVARIAPTPGRVTASPLVHAPTATTAPNGMDAESEAAIKAELRKQYDSLSGEAKREACERLKDQFPDDSNVQALDCANATFDKVVTVVGAAIGTAVCGPTCGALGVIAAQYFGEDLNELWNDLTSISGDGDPCTGTYHFLGFATLSACQEWKRIGKPAGISPTDWRNGKRP